MFVFEITTPGSSLDHEDREWSNSIEGQLQALRSRFFEANAALNLFIKSRSGTHNQRSRVNKEIDSQLRSEIQETLEREYEKPLTEEKLHEIRFEAEVHLKREKWRKGIVPWEFEHRLPLVYARTFMQAVDGFDRVLEGLSQMTNAPGNLLKLYGEMAVRFPHLRILRSEAQCMEQDIYDPGPYKKHQSWEPGPVNRRHNNVSRESSAPLESLNGSRYSTNKADGQSVEIDISPESMHHLQVILEGVLLSFKWRGPKRHEPSA
jgi:hypothetical protein